MPLSAETAGTPEEKAQNPNLRGTRDETPYQKQLQMYKFHIRSRWNKTRPQQQKKTQKIFKHMETEQYTSERPVTKETREEIKKYLESNEN
jgi:hypothetical protein